MYAHYRKLAEENVSQFPVALSLIMSGMIDAGKNVVNSLYDDIFALKGWKKEELGGIEFELNSILVEKWKGKAYRLVIQRQKRMDGELDLWEGEYTYRCILTNDHKSSEIEIVEFYNLRGGKERIFDDMNNGFGWNRPPKSFNRREHGISSAYGTHTKLLYIHHREA